MKNFFLFLSILAVSLFALDKNSNLSQIKQDININQKKIQKKEDEKNQINNLLQKLGNKINQTNQQIKKLDIEIVAVQNSISNNQDKNSDQEKLLLSLQNILASLQKQKQEIREKITKILINDLAFIMILNHENPISPDDIILQEIFKNLNKTSQQKISQLSSEEKILESKIAQTQEAITILGNRITLQQNKKKYLQKILKDQKNLIANFQRDLQTYNQKLKQIDAERKKLDSLLSRLNIIKQTKEKEIAEAERQRQLAEKEKQSNQSNVAIAIPQGPINVKQVANSYQELSTAKYKGQKTIAPIDSYEVEQKFGTYFDPVYRLKVFNESVILNSKVQNAPVKSIFDGKIVYAKEIPLLKKVIIIENQNGIHTIYSQLDKIAPTIRVGLKIQKGYIIGRVTQKLSFEITQKDKHIDPLEVIAKSR